MALLEKMGPTLPQYEPGGQTEKTKGRLRWGGR